MTAGMAAAPLGAANAGQMTAAEQSAVLAEIEALGARVARVRAAISRVIAALVTVLAESTEQPYRSSHMPGMALAKPEVHWTQVNTAPASSAGQRQRRNFLAGPQ